MFSAYDHLRGDWRDLVFHGHGPLLKPDRKLLTRSGISGLSSRLFTSDQQTLKPFKGQVFRYEY